jgi:2-oxoacid:acceptor oxidoreductase gamma subunit (pyruvate/2-ketoisovalerate family)
MIEIKISGRGGQGVVLASQIIAGALFSQGMWVQSFPSFGAERRGAPVSAFVRADAEEITLRCGIYNPDWVVLFDAGLIDNSAATTGINAKTSILINGSKELQPTLQMAYHRCLSINATEIAEAHQLKTTSFTIVNTTMVGAFAGASGLMDIESAQKAISGMVPVKKEENAAAAVEAYQKIQELTNV